MVGKICIMTLVLISEFDFVTWQEIIIFFFEFDFVNFLTLQIMLFFKHFWCIGCFSSGSWLKPMYAFYDLLKKFASVY
jgi:hypothetical protein